VRDEKQVVGLIGFWVARMGDGERLKRNKYASRGAISREGSGEQGKNEDLRRRRAKGVYTRGHRIGE
jgi:hypothetical protein